MKKSLSIKNSQGIYVARASFSSDETIIDFVKNSNPHSCSSTDIADPIESNIETQSIQSLPNSPQKRLAKRRNPVHKVLKILHLKRKSTNKMDEQGGSDAVASSSSSKPSTSKGRTATLVKKVSISKKNDDGAMKSSIPLRSATSVETISHSLTASAPTAQSTTTATLSVSEMNLVNIDYRQEGVQSSARTGAGVGNNFNIDLQIDRRTHFQNIRSKFDGDGSGGQSALGNRAYGSNSARPGGRTGKTNQLQITISGTKRSSTVKNDEPQVRHQRVESIESRRTTTQKSNSSRGGIAFNRIGVPPAPTTQAPTMPYRITGGGKIENVVSDSDGSRTKSVMSAPPIASEASKAPIEPSIDERAKHLPTKLLTSATATSFDCDDLEQVAHPLTPDERRNSLLSELIEAENREPMTKLPERGRRYPGMAASETIKFQLQTKVNAEPDDESAVKALTTVAIPTVRIDSPPAINVPMEPTTDDDVIASADVTEDTEKPDVTPTIQFEVGKEVRPIITSHTNLRQNISTTYDNDPTAATAAFGSMSLRQDYANAIGEPHSLVSNSSKITLSLSPDPTPPPPPPSVARIRADTDTEAHHRPVAIDTDAIADESQTKNYAKQHHRRRIAYIAQATENSNDSASTSHSIEDEELIATSTTTTTTATANTADFSDQFRFDSTLTQFSDTLITDYFMMPAYGDLVWSDDGVKSTILSTHTHTNQSTKFLSFPCLSLSYTLSSFSRVSLFLL